MKFSSNLIKRFINIQDDWKNISNNLILKTCEVEEIIKREIPKTIVIGKILELKKHPDADTLSVCIVDCGEHGKLQIICGGTNLQEGAFVPVALSGTYFAKPDLTIEPRKMRGVESNGMICSKEELDINEDLEEKWIWLLKQNTTLDKGKIDFPDITDSDLGTPLITKYPWLNNTILDVDNKGLTHRSDLTGHFGLASELNTIYYTHDKSKIGFNKIKEYFEHFKNINIQDLLDNSNQSKTKVISKTEGLNSYILMEINDIQVQNADFITRLEMIDLGNNPISNRVDFSNIFMNLSGQPIHFFDADKIKGDIIVRNAKKGEKFIDLFETEHELSIDDIIITDQEKILALAGIVGGLQGGIDENTKNILVEIANFDHIAVRKTGVRLGMRTDAELRFEKYINPVYSLYCLILFLDAIKYYEKDLGKYNIGGLSYVAKDDIYKFKNKTIQIDISKASQFILGKKDSKVYDKFERILIGLGFGIEKLKGKDSLIWMISVPFRRSPEDIDIPEDIYEELARIYGYENIQQQDLTMNLKSNPYVPAVKLQRTLESIITQSLQFNQMETYPRVSEQVLNSFQVDFKKLLQIKNPANIDEPYLRDSIIYPLLQYVKKNSKFFENIKIFDIGKVWSKNNPPDKGGKGGLNSIGEGKLSAVKKENFHSGDLDGNGEENPPTPFNHRSSAGHGKGGVDLSKYSHSVVGEYTQVAMIYYQKETKSWDQDLLLQAKSDISIMLDNLGLNGKLEYQATDKQAFHPKKQGNILYNRQEIGFVGTLHPLINKDYKINESSAIVYVSFDFDKLLEIHSKLKVKSIYEILQDQIVWRDLSFVVDEKENYGKVLDAIKTVKEIEDLEVFDLYKGDNLEHGKKSISIKIKIKGENMKTEDINAVMDKAIAKAEKAGGVLRGE